MIALIMSTARAYAIRTCLNIAGVPFEDERISFNDLKARRGESGRSKEVPLGSLPVLTFPDGKVVTQSLAIARYAAKLAKLYPEDPLQALFVDEIIDTVGDVTTNAPQNPDAETKKKLREEYAAGKMNTFYSYFAEKLTASSGPFLFGASFTVADIALYGLLKSVRGGNFDYIPGDYDAKWPVLQQFIDALEANAVFAPHKL